MVYLKGDDVSCVAPFPDQLQDLRRKCIGSPISKLALDANDRSHGPTQLREPSPVYPVFLYLPRTAGRSCQNAPPCHLMARSANCLVNSWRPNTLPDVCIVIELSFIV